MSNAVEDTITGVLVMLAVTAVASAIAFLILWGAKSTDENHWNGPVNGCYVHVVDHNYFWDHADYKTRYVYCKTGAQAK